VTTASLEALQDHSLGTKAVRVRAEYAAAIPLLERAVSVDPNFAVAYARLGSTYRNVSDVNRGIESVKKAYELRSRVTGRENFYITSQYEYIVKGDFEAASKTDEDWEKAYPRDPVPPHNLAAVYGELGEHDRSVEQLRDSLRLDPESGIGYGNLIGTYVILNRLDDAKAAAQEAQARHLDTANNHFTYYLIDFLEHDEPGMERDAAYLVGKAEYAAGVLDMEAATAAYGGEFSRARELEQRALALAARGADKFRPPFYECRTALREAMVGNMAFAKQHAAASVNLSNDSLNQGRSAIALGLAGDTAEANSLAADLARQFPENTLVQSELLPTIRATVLLRSGEPGKAIEELERAKQHELAAYASGLLAAYVRGEAYLAAGQGTAAAGEFQKILDHSGIVTNDPMGALAHLGLARSYVRAGDAARARTAYQDFFVLWKDADPDLPILISAKSEYAKLQ
jgi:tetratricopeptide (TPR) repeat protein